MSWKFSSVLVLAIGIGLGICWIDSRPGWDDTGITAGAVFAATVVLGVAVPERPWVWAVAVGTWIPLYGFLNSGNPASIVALVIAFAGAYTGWSVRRAWSGRQKRG
jgi:hypothetical protein